jgi:hypothetical protein
MASYHFEIKSGRKGCAADQSNYIARMGKYRGRDDLVEQGSGNMPNWAATARTLWATADKYERANGAAYREYVIPLPSELLPEQQHELVVALTVEFAGRKPFQYAVHAPVSSLAGELNPHLHLMVTDRIPDGIDRNPELVFRRYNGKKPELGGWKKDSGGRTPIALRDELIAKRKRCAELENEALARHGHTERVDHRTLSEQGAKRIPEKRIEVSRIKNMSEQDKKDHVASRDAKPST